MLVASIHCSDLPSSLAAIRCFPLRFRHVFFGFVCRFRLAVRFEANIIEDRLSFLVGPTCSFILHIRLPIRFEVAVLGFLHWFRLPLRIETSLIERRLIGLIGSATSFGLPIRFAATFLCFQFVFLVGFKFRFSFPARFEQSFIAAFKLPIVCTNLIRCFRLPALFKPNILCDSCGLLDGAIRCFNICIRVHTTVLSGNFGSPVGFTSCFIPIRFEARVIAVRLGLLVGSIRILALCDQLGMLVGFVTSFFLRTICFVAILGAQCVADSLCDSVGFGARSISCFLLLVYDVVVASFRRFIWILPSRSIFGKLNSVFRNFFVLKISHSA